MSESILTHAANLMAHRGPDDKGIYLDGNIGLSHRRLSIYDTSSGGHQPMHKHGRSIVFNGAIYNFLALQSELIEAGYTFSSECDTEVILSAYDAWGEGCVHRFNGIWALAIYDPTAHTLWCSRDRFGVKPLHYCLGKDYIAFSSEIKALEAVPSWEARLQEDYAYDFLAYGLHDHSAATMYQGVYRLLPGHNLTVDIHTRCHDIQSYYSLDALTVNHNMTLPDAVSRLTTQWRETMMLQQSADRKIGAALSGGLDSSSIVCMHNQLYPDQRLDTISYLPSDAVVTEADYVDLVNAATKGSSHVVTTTAAALWDCLDTVIRCQEEPFGGLSIVAQYEVFRVAKAQGIAVMLDGQGADEIFAGYHKFLLPFLREHPSQILSVLSIINYNRSSFVKQAATYLRKRHASVGDYMDLDPTEGLTSLSASTVLDVSQQILSGMGLNALLRTEDRNAMAHGIESRVPYLDHKLVELALSIPARYKIRAGQTKWALRAAMEGVVPDRVRMRRDKMQFDTAELRYFRKEEATLKQHYIEACEAAQGILRPEGWEELRSDYTRLFRAICFGRWMRVMEVNR